MSRVAVAVMCALVGAACDPGAAPASARVAKASARASDTLAGSYRITSAGAAKVERWAGVFKQPEGTYRRIQHIDVARAADGGDLLVSVGERGPYRLRATGNRSWSRPLQRGFNVTLTHHDRGDRPDALRVRVGPISITYVHQ